MTFEEIIRELSGEDQKIVSDIMLLYEDIDRQIAAFSFQSGVRCKSGCSVCCKNEDIETTVAEVLPVALRLWAQGQAQDHLETIRLKDYKGACVFYQPQHAGAPGCCSIYEYRPGLCRLFGFCARRDKYGQPVLMTCRIIKENQPQICAQACGAPLLNLHAWRVSNIDPAAGGKLFPINQAVGLALEKVGRKLKQ
jgi:Fe-S-cluster containining protein